MLYVQNRRRVQYVHFSRMSLRLLNCNMHALENFAITEHLLEKQTLSRGVSSGVEWASQVSDS